MNTKNSIRVIVADDHKLLRDSLCTWLVANSDMEVVAQASDGRMAVQLAQELSPDIVIMDISMPYLNGIEATRQIKATAPGVKVLVVSGHDDRQYVTGAFQAGASGYLLKDSAMREVCRAINDIMADQTYLSPGVAR